MNISSFYNYSAVSRPLPGPDRAKYVYILLLFLLIPLIGFSQNSSPDSSLVFSFAKANASLKEAGTYFNVIRLENRGEKTIQGKLMIRQPETWTLIGSSRFDIEIDPGEQKILPVRIGIPKNTIGGVSYLIRAILQLEEETLYRGAYVSVEKQSSWRMYVEKSDIYVTEFRPVGSFNIRLQNQGNADELIKLTFDKGELIAFRSFIEADSVMFVELGAYKDTLLRFDITQRKDLSYSALRTLRRNWKSNSIYIKASTSEKQEYSGVRLFSLKSEKINDAPLRSSPLNLDMTLFNLLSQQRPKASVKLHGRVLFPDNQQIQYSAGMYNLYFNPQMYENLDLNQMVRYILRYNDRNTQVFLGDRLGTGSLHSMTGRGIRAQHNLKDRHNVYLNVIQNPYGGSIGSYAGYSTMFGTLAANTGITLEKNPLSNNSYYSYHLGGSFKIRSRHTFRIQTATSFNRFAEGRYLDKDTTTIGISYRVGYRYKDEKTSLRIDNTNTTHSYLRNAGINRLDFDLKYKVNENFRIYSLFNHNGYSASRYPYNFYYPDNRNINDNGRILLSFNRGNVVYQAGPQYFGSIRRNFNPATGTSTIYENYQPGVISSVTFKIGNIRSITPSFSFNSMYVNYSSGIPEETDYSLSGRWKYTAGISYYDLSFRLNAFYSSGDASDIYRSVVVDDTPDVNQSIHLRPYYEKYFKDETIRLSAYMNYSYYMPSQRENTIFNVGADFKLQSGWDLFTSFNVYLNSRVDEDMGRVTARNINLLAGFRKSFDIQQPRMKYHDLTIVGFNDQNGNQVKDKDEKPISNVLINIARDPDKNDREKADFAETRLVTDPNGVVYYENIPEGRYDLEITPLSNLENLYFLDGQKQIIEANKDKVHYLPLVESYRVSGKIIIDRDPNSNAGNMNLEGIRITAESENGARYSALTSSTGGYVLNLPKANRYKIKIYNVFGERFLLEQDEYEVQFMQNKSINIDFRFREQRRNIKFNEGEELFQFKIDDTEE